MKNSSALAEDLNATREQLKSAIGWLEPKEVIQANKILKHIDINIEYLSFCISESTRENIHIWFKEVKEVIDIFTIKAGLNRLEIEYVA